MKPLLLLPLLLLGCAKPIAKVAPSATAVRVQVGEARLNVSAAKSNAAMGESRAKAAATSVSRAQTEIAQADAAVDVLAEKNPTFSKEFAELKFRFRVVQRELESTQEELSNLRIDLGKVIATLTLTDEQLVLAEARAKELQTAIDSQTVALGKAQSETAVARLSASKAQTVAAKATAIAVVLGVCGVAATFVAIKFF